MSVIGTNMAIKLTSQSNIYLYVNIVHKAITALGGYDSGTMGGVGHSNILTAATSTIVGSCYDPAGS